MTWRFSYVVLLQPRLHQCRFVAFCVVPWIKPKSCLVRWLIHRAMLDRRRRVKRGLDAPKVCTFSMITRFRFHQTSKFLNEDRDLLWKWNQHWLIREKMLWCMIFYPLHKAIHSIVYAILAKALCLRWQVIARTGRQIPLQCANDLCCTVQLAPVQNNNCNDARTSTYFLICLLVWNELECFNNFAPILSIMVSGSSCMSHSIPTATGKKQSGTVTSTTGWFVRWEITSSVRWKLGTRRRVQRYTKHSQPFAVLVPYLATVLVSALPFFLPSRAF